LKKKLIIIGAGNVGGFLAYNMELFDLDYDLIGFLDDDPKKIGQTFFGLPVLGSISTIEKYPLGIDIVIGIASPKIKKLITHKLGKYNFQYPSFIANKAWVSKEVKIGQGSIIYPGVSINHHTNIGDFVIMNMNCAIGHDCTITDYCSLAPGVNLGGFTYLEPLVDMGIGSATIQQIRIGENAIIGGQSMLIRNVPENSKIVGIPGQPL